MPARRRRGRQEHPIGDAEDDGHGGAVRAETRDRLAPDAGVAAALTGLCVTAVEEHGLLGAVVTVMTVGAASAVAAASDEGSRLIDEIQFAVGEGPAEEAFTSGRPVLVSDLAERVGRWPGYAPEAMRAGVCAVHTFPVQFGAARFGVLTLYVERPHLPTTDELNAFLIAAEVVTEILLQRVGAGAGGTADTGLEDALHMRTEIYQAQGMVMVQLGVSLVEALARMRAHAFAAELELTKVALGIVAGTVQLQEDRP